MWRVGTGILYILIPSFIPFPCLSYPFLHLLIPVTVCNCVGAEDERLLRVKIQLDHLEPCRECCTKASGKQQQTEASGAINTFLVL